MRTTPLPLLATATVSGHDARSFLQGQLTQDLAALGAQVASLGAFLSPQGRVLALARLLARGESIVLVLPADLAEPTLVHLRRYVLRAKVTLALAGEVLGVTGLLADSPGELDARFGAAAPGAHQAIAGGASLVRLGERALLLGTPAAIAAAAGDGRPAAAADWEIEAVRAGEPAVVAATAGHWIPQMLNLDCCGAISFTKGCYTGQEIVARTQHLGRIKRRMFRYRLAAAGPLPQPGDPLSRGGARVGEVVRAAAVGGSTELLAVVSLEAAAANPRLEAGGALESLPLPYAVS